MLKDYYAVLRIGRTATAPEIKAAYRQLAAENHPDKVARFGPSAERHAALVMRELNEAIEVLGDPASRSRYDTDRASSEFGGLDDGGAYRPRAAPCGQPSEEREASISTAASVEMIGRVFTLPERFFTLPLHWVKLKAPSWNWCIAGSGIGRPIVIAYRHVDELDVPGVRLLDAAISRLNRVKPSPLAPGPWPVILVTTKHVRRAQETVPLLNQAAIRHRGFLNRKPMLVVYDAGKGATLRLGRPPRHLFIASILHFVLEP